MGTEPEKKEATVEDRIGTLEEVVGELIDKAEALTKELASARKAVASVTKAKGLFGGKREQTPTKDLVTGKVYISKAAVGKLFSGEVGLEATNHFAWYRVSSQLRMPDGSPRFVDAGPEEAEKIKAEMKAEAERAAVAAEKAAAEAEAKEKAATEKAAAEEAAKAKKAQSQAAKK